MVPIEAPPSPWTIVFAATTIFGSVLSATALGRTLRQDVRAKASMEGATDVIIKELQKKISETDGFGQETKTLRHDVNALQAASDRTNNSLNDHLLECAKARGRAEEAQKGMTASMERMERSIGEMQRTIANWMRDGEHSSRRSPMR